MPLRQALANDTGSAGDIAARTDNVGILRAAVLKGRRRGVSSGTLASRPKAPSTTAP